MGWLLGFLASVILYVGYYHAGFVRTAGLEHVFRFDQWPSYFVWRMETTVWARALDPILAARKEAQHQREGPMAWRVAGNVIIVLVEGGFLFFVFPLLGVVRASRAYNENRRCWTTLQIEALEPGSAPVLAEGLARGSFGSALDHCKWGRPRGQHCEIAVEYTRPGPDERATDPVYLTLRELGSLAGPFAKLNFYIHYSRRLIRPWELNRDEINALRSVFPDLPIPR